MNYKLKNLLQFIEKNNDFYRNRFESQGISFFCKDSDIEHNYSLLTKLKKEEIVDRSNWIITKGFLDSQLETQHTSGSTGNPLWIYKTPKEIFAQSLHLWNYRKHRANILPNDKYVRTHISQRHGKQLNVKDIIYDSNFISYNMLFIDHTTLRKYYDELFIFRPKWMLMNPSFLYILTEFILSNKLDIPKIEYIELTGEYLSEEQKKYFAANWNCIVANHYGCREVYAIALECECGNLHIVNDNVIVEIEKNTSYTNGFGDILITSLHGKAMPFIKYEIGDIGKIETYRCNCGNQNPILTLLAGRQSEYFENNGKRVHSSVFHYIIKKVNLKNNDDITFFKVTQNGSRIDFYIRIKDEMLFERISNDIILEASTSLTDYSVTVNFLDISKFFFQKNGKHNIIQYSTK